MKDKQRDKATKVVQSTRRRQTGLRLGAGLAVLVWLEAGLADEWPLEACRQVALAESGLERYEEGDLDGTIQAFEALVEADSSAAAAHHALGRAQRGLRQCGSRWQPGWVQRSRPGGLEGYDPDQYLRRCSHFAVLKPHTLLQPSEVAPKTE